MPIRETTIRDVLNNSDLNEVADVLKKIKAGNMFSRIKVVAAGLTAAASFDITTAAFKALSTITGITLQSDETLPPIGMALGLQLTASGTAGSLGTYLLGPVTATPAIPAGGANVTPGVARLSDDGKTITFPNTVTAFTFIYMPAPFVALNTEFPANAP
jgi:hypothetical protein